MAEYRRPLIVHADAPTASQLSEERLGMGDLDCEFVATEAGSEDELVANLRDADVVLVAPRLPLERRSD